MRRFEKIDAAKNMSRYYQLQVLPDLFGGFVLVCEWGRIGRQGQEQRHHFATMEEAVKALEQRSQKRERRNYKRVG